MQVRKQIAASIPMGRGNVSRAAGIRERLAGAGQFIRFSALGATLVLPLMGAASAGGRLRPASTMGLVVVASMFHAFAYVLNDVVDLPVDRSEPRRSRSPLVRGTVTRGRAGAFALVQVPAAFAVASWAGADHRAIGALA